MDTTLFENEAYMRMLYDQFRTSTNGQFGDNTLLTSAIGEVFCNSPHTMIYVGCGSGNGLSSFGQAYHPKQWICIDSNPDLLKRISFKCTKICSTISSRDHSLAYRFSDPTFCGLTDVSPVLIDQYKLVRLPNEEVKCKPLDSVIEGVGKESKALVIDVPGSEIDILQSGNRVLSSVQYLVVKSYRPSSKMPLLYNDAERMISSLGYKLTRCIDDDAYTCWSVWTRWTPDTKWNLSVYTTSSDIGKYLYRLCGVYYLSTLHPERDFKMPSGTPLLHNKYIIPEEEYRTIKWHTAVYEDTHAFSNIYLPENHHVVVNSAFQNNRYVYPCLKEFMKVLPPINEEFSYSLFDCLRAQVSDKRNVCLVMLDNKEEYIQKSIQEMKEQGATAFIGCRLRGDSKCVTIEIDYIIGEELEMLRKNEWLMLCVLSHFNYFIMDSSCISQWIRLIHRDTLCLKWCCPVEWYE